MNKYLIVIALLLGLTSTAQAALDYGLELGVRQQSGDAYGPDISTNSRTGFQGGAFAHFPLQGDTAHFRTGLLYTQRPLETENDSSGSKIQWNLDYIDIPVTILFKPHEKFGIYLGFIASINVAKSCSGDSNCKVSSVDTPTFPGVFGATVKFNTKWGLNLYFDSSYSTVAKGLADYKAAGLNLMFSLD
ncbi:outer membrane beta-barrel protein [Bdellovibrio sp. HCB209]|uniref:outer membrane beta-barrel protein n=1 Tax=Bdellovibrio sp. HCB209 TaxID=3394354 RepID=UPI0039B54E88